MLFDGIIQNDQFSSFLVISCSSNDFSKRHQENEKPFPIEIVHYLLPTLGVCVCVLRHLAYLEFRIKLYCTFVLLLCAVCRD